MDIKVINIATNTNSIDNNSIDNNSIDNNSIDINSININSIDTTNPTDLLINSIDTNIINLPDEIIINIMKLLNLHDLLQLSAICHYLRNVFIINKFQLLTPFTATNTGLYSIYNDIYPSIGKYRHGAYFNRLVEQSSKKRLEYYIFGEQTESFGTYTGDQYMHRSYDSGCIVVKYTYIDGKLSCLVDIQWDPANDECPCTSSLVGISIYSNDIIEAHWTNNCGHWYKSALNTSDIASDAFEYIENVPEDILNIDQQIEAYCQSKIDCC